MSIPSQESTVDRLKEHAQWICYNADKMPYNPHTGYGADCNNPETWTTFSEAIQTYQSNPSKYKGVGFEFVKEQGITGVDLDKCIDDEGNFSPFAQEVVRRLNSYTEYSPSGKGLHIWVRGSIPNNIGPNPKLDGNQRIEAYDCLKYFTVTEKHLPGTPETIEDRQEELTALFNEITARRQAAKKATKEPQQRATNPETVNTLYGLKALDAECHEVATMPEGGRNDRLNQAAYSLGQLVGGGELLRETVERKLTTAAELSGLGSREIERTIKSGLEDGMKQPRNSSIDTFVYGVNGTGPKSNTDETAKELPAIVIGGQLREVRDHALAALADSEKSNPTIFVQSARLVQVARDEANKPIIMQIGVPELKNNLTRSANYYRIKALKSTGEVEYIAHTPPKEIAEAILALNPSTWPFPPLEAIVETPVVRPDGTILDTPGYDPSTKLYYAPHHAMSACKVPCNPTPEQRKAALDFIWGVIGEFPYAEQADKANALALLITPVIRPAIKRHIPLALVDAPKQGTGKGLLADVVSISATGEAASILTAPDNDEEWDKRITAKLIQGSTIITLDNLPGRLHSPKLDAVLTATMWEGRLLGQSKMIKVPQRATWLATGNNIRVGGDLARRCYRIRLDPHVSRPWTRAGFQHEDLATYVTEHRAEIIAALLTLVRAWYADGCPQAECLPALGTFTGWVKMVGSILAHAGVEGFLNNLGKLYEDVDDENAEWALFLQAWHDKLGDRAITIGALVSELEAENLPGSVENLPGSLLSEYLPEFLQVAQKEKPASFKIRFGKALEKRLETCFGDNNLRIERRVDKDKNQKLWRVVPGSAGSVPSHVQKKNEDFSKEKKINRNGRNNYQDYQGPPESIPDTDQKKEAVKALEKPMEVQTLSVAQTVSVENTTRKTVTLPVTYPKVKPEMCQKHPNHPAIDAHKRCEECHKDFLASLAEPEDNTLPEEDIYYHEVVGDDIEEGLI